MTTLGLTGGIGSGKSAAAARFAEHPGVVVVRADAVARRLMDEDEAVREAVRERFGADAYRPDGPLDRAALAARVFANEGELADLNAIVHPAVARELRAAMESARASGADLLVYESALLFETGSDALFDHVAAVYAPIETRVVRTMERDGATRAEVLRRMASQMPPRDLRSRADTVLDNDGPLAALREQVDALHARLVAREGGAA